MRGRLSVRRTIWSSLHSPGFLPDPSRRLPSSSDPSRAPVPASRTAAQLHHQLLAPPEALLTQATYRPLPYQGLYPRISSPRGVPRARHTPYPLPSMQADELQETRPLPAGLRLLSPTALCRVPGQDPPLRMEACGQSPFTLDGTPLAPLPSHAEQGR